MSLVRVFSSLFFSANLTVCASLIDSSQLMQTLQSCEPAILQSLIDYKVPGAAVGIVMGGELVYAKGFGKADLETGLPVTEDTIFQIGSCTKAFTSFLVGTLIERSVIFWDQPIIDLLPRFRLKDSYATHHATIRDLLSHRSGFPRHALSWYGSTHLKRDDLIERLRYLELSTDFRDRYQYGDLMYLAVAAALEEIEGKSWEEQIGEKILTPLHMTRTGYSLQEAERMGNCATPHMAKKESVKRMAFRDFSLIGPAGGLYSTIKDLSEWVKMHLNRGVANGVSFISPVVLQEMYAPQSIVPGAPQTKESPLCLSGLGWNLMPYRGHYFVSHDGGVDGFTSVVGLFPEEKMGIIVLTNCNLNPLARYLSTYLIDQLLGLSPIDWLNEGAETLRKNWEIEEENKAAEGLTRKMGTTPSHPLSHYAGFYTHPGYGQLIIEEDVNGRLKITLNDLSAYLDHWHYDVFVLSDEQQDMIQSREGTKFTFHTGVDGEITKISAPLEPTTKEIVFIKDREHSEEHASYLQQFVGFYEIYGHVVEIALRDGVLYGILPGQPVYELIPDKENHFVVKSLGYSLHFNLDKNRKVERAVLSLPYGSFSAQPKNLS
ncbi:MAG TPA: serine hydrolase [Chlamydiales bacterium]|nr:serine hydrolase [Chlamydiales bacterium]